MSYSANDELEILAKKLGFKCYIFDDGKSPSKLRAEQKRGEIDAILVHNNIIILVGINKGQGNNVKREIKKFFDGLSNVKDYHDILNLEFDGLVPDKLQNSLKKIKKAVRKKSKSYKMIIKKIFFAPNKEMEDNPSKETNDIIIDKDVSEYFSEVSKALTNNILLHDFFYFLDIKEIDLDEKGSSKTDKPEKSKPFKVDRLSLDTKNEMIMYSLSLKVKDISDYITVLRLANKYDKKGFQRMINGNRLKKIDKDYLGKNRTFPNNIIILLNPETYRIEGDFYNDNEKELCFLKEFNSLIIIDGQHRFFSFINGNKTDREILISLIFLKNNKKLEAEKMFYEINKQQKRIDPNLSFILKARIDEKSEENFWYEVFNKLIKKGFLKGRFSFKETILRKKSDKKSIISVIKYGGILSFNKNYNKNEILIDGFNTFYNKKRSGNIDIAYSIIKNYFDIIESVLHNQNFDKESLTPRDIGALLRLLRHFMIDNKENVKKLGSTYNIMKKDSKDEENKKIIDYFKNIISYINFNEVSNQKFSASNWGVVEGYMFKQINNKNPRFGSENLLTKKGKEIYENGMTGQN